MHPKQAPICYALLMEKVKVWLRRGRCSHEQEIVASLIKDGHDPLQIAAIALKLACKDDNKRPIVPISEVCEHHLKPSRKRGVKRKTRKKSTTKTTISSEKGMVRIMLDSSKSYCWHYRLPCRYPRWLHRQNQYSK